MNNDSGFDASDFEPTTLDLANLKRLKGAKKHFCPYVWHMPIDEHAEEFESCRCDFERPER